MAVFLFYCIIFIHIDQIVDRINGLFVLFVLDVGWHLTCVSVKLSNVKCMACCFAVLDEIVTGSMQTPFVKPDLNKANPKLGVSTVQFSTNCKYMYSRNGK